MIVVRFSMQRKRLFLAHQWQVACLYHLNMQEEDILEHTHGNCRLCEVQLIVERGCAPHNTIIEHSHARISVKYT
jgi:hypothetical protein